LLSGDFQPTFGRLANVGKRFFIGVTLGITAFEGWHFSPEPSFFRRMNNT